MELRCKKILVTGGSRGIGFAIAKRLCDEGAQVVVTGRYEDTLREAANRISPERAYPMVMDMREVSLFENGVKKAAQLMNGLDGLVNNAGVNVRDEYEWGDKIWELSPDDWDWVTDTNLRGVFFLMRAAARHMLDNRTEGNILNVSSEAAFQPAMASYGVSKHGVRALTGGWGRMLIKHGIVVNGVAPGTSETDMIDIPLAKSIRRQLNGRLGKPEEMAALAAFLMSREGENIIGQTILSCGGSTF